MKPAAMSRPGSTPAVNRSATLTPLTRAKRIIGIDGGIRMSITAEVALLAAQSPPDSLLRCHGIRIEPSALALATALPETPPNTTEATTVVDNGPPRKRPINSVAKASSSLPSTRPSSGCRRA